MATIVSIANMDMRRAEAARMVPGLGKAAVGALQGARGLGEAFGIAQAAGEARARIMPEREALTRKNRA
nr:hypothetical protein [Marinicella sp. W31]MDC2877456.1 hypothetical protein [Marinicella sp. W31]